MTIEAYSRLVDILEKSLKILDSVETRLTSYNCQKFLKTKQQFIDGTTKLRMIVACPTLNDDMVNHHIRNGIAGIKLLHARMGKCECEPTSDIRSEIRIACQDIEEFLNK